MPAVRRSTSAATLWLVLLGTAASPAVAQMKDAGPPTSATTGNTLDLLVDMAASAPRRDAPPDRGPSAAPTTDAGRDSRQKLLEQLKAGSPNPATPPSTNGNAAPPVPMLEPASVIAGSRAEGAQSNDGELVKQQIEVETAARQAPPPAQEQRLSVPQDSWIRAVAYWIRDNRTWVVVITAVLLAIAWIASALFARSRASGASAGSGRQAATGTAGGAWAAAGRPATRPVRRQPRSHRPR